MSDVQVKADYVGCTMGLAAARGLTAAIAVRPQARVIGLIGLKYASLVAELGRAAGREVAIFAPSGAGGGAGESPGGAGAAALGANLVWLRPGRDALVAAAARRTFRERYGTGPGAYLLPAGLCLPEQVAETRREYERVAIQPAPRTIVVKVDDTVGRGVCAATAAGLLQAVSDQGRWSDTDWVWDGATMADVANIFSLAGTRTDQYTRGPMKAGDMRRPILHWRLR